MEGKIVKVITRGQTKFVYHDDYCKRSPEEIKAVLDRIAEIAFPALRASEMRRKKERIG